MKTKHTQGEWYYRNHEGTQYYDILISDGLRAKGVARVYDKNEANAKLIAAAPTLLKALKEVINCNSIELPEDIHIEVAKAINKAIE